MSQPASSKCYHFKRIPLLLYIALGTTLFSAGCENRSDQAPDISHIQLSLNTARFDLDLYALDTNHLGSGLRRLYDKYPDFLNYYLDTIRQYGIYGHFSDTAKGGMDTLRVDLTYKDFVRLEDTIKKYYPDSKATDKELTQAFKLMKYYLPDYQAPRIIYLNMGLSKWASFPVDTKTICVGLDMFLGEQYPYYRSVGVSGYMLTHFRKAYLPVSVLNSVYQTLHPFSQEDRTLLDLMIQRGKEQYFLHKIFPGSPDSLLFGFSQLQVKWCNENEGLVYNFFIHQKLLYNKEGHNILPYVYDGPFAKDLESPADPVKYTPGNIGTWLGYRIVSQWMNQHPQTTLEMLLKQTEDPTRFLEEAEYRPK